MNQTNNVRSATPSAQIKLYQQYHSYSKARASTIPIMVNMDRSNGHITTTQYSISDLIFAEYNPRELTKDQHQDLKDSITRFGLVDPLIVNTHKERKNVLVGGHQRLRIAKELGYKSVSCVEVELTPEKERELNIRLNKNTGQWDWDALANHFDVGELLEWGFSEQELGWNKAPADDDWAQYFEEKGDTSGVDDRHQITFVLNEPEMETLKSKLQELDKNKNKAIMMLL